MLQAPPERWQPDYHRHETEGITVFVPPGLVMNAHALTLKTVGIWGLRWIQVLGVAPAAACCI